MTQLVNARIGIQAAALNELSILIRSGLAGNLPTQYKSAIDELTITDGGDVFGETVEDLEDLILVWGEKLGASSIGLIANAKYRNDYIKLMVYTNAEVDVTDVVVNNVTIKQYLNRRGGELLLQVVYQKNNQSLTYHKFWE